MDGLILKGYFRSLLAILLTASCNPFALCQPDAQRSVADLVAAHVDQMKKLQPIHYKIVNYKGNKEDKNYSRETWSSPSRSASVNKDYLELKYGKYIQLDETKCALSTTIRDDKTVKTIHGFDLNHVPSQPLELGRDAAEFERIYGTLKARDPKVDSLGSFFGVTSSLKSLANITELSVEKSDVPNLVCIAVKSSPLNYIGARKMYLDPSKNFMAAKKVDSSGKVETVVDWHEVEPGLWFPKKITYHDKAGMLVEISEVEFAKKMTPADLKLLETSFPEGSRVYETIQMPLPELEKYLFHLWGKGGPEVTFDTVEELLEYANAKARAYHAKNFVNTPLGIWLGIGLASLALAVFMFWKKFSPRKA